MPLYIAQSGDLEECHACLTHSLSTESLTTLKDSATQRLIKYKSGALVTQMVILLANRWIHGRHHRHHNYNIVTTLLLIIITTSIVRPSITDELGEENQKLVPSPSQGQRVRVLLGQIICLYSDLWAMVHDF